MLQVVSLFFFYLSTVCFKKKFFLSPGTDDWIEMGQRFGKFVSIEKWLFEDEDDLIS